MGGEGSGRRAENPLTQVQTFTPLMTKGEDGVLVPDYSSVKYNDTRWKNWSTIVEGNKATLSAGYLAHGGVTMSLTHGFKMIRAGCITGLSITHRVTGLLTSGDQTYSVQVNGVSVTGIVTPITVGNTIYRNSATFAMNAYRFQAGDVISLVISGIAAATAPTIGTCELTFY